jgi:hypothetical protein
MALERISAVTWPALERNAPEAPRRSPTAGDTLELTLAEALLDEVLATTSDGLPLRLAGLGQLARHLSIGDVLLVRVLATSPRLELALFETPSRPSTATAPYASSSQAMQPDQLSQRQLNWRPPQAAALATSWHTMVLSQVEGEAVSARRATSPPTTPPVPDARVLPQREPWLATPLTGPHRWLFPAYAWAGLHVMLRLVEPDDDEPPRPPRRRRGPMALRIEVDAPSLGGIELHLQLLAQGVALVFFVERHAALAVVRQAVPTIAQALAAAGLRLLRCGVVRGLPPLTGATRLDAWPSGASASTVLPTALFRAAAEVTVVFAPMLLPRGLKP